MNELLKVTVNKNQEQIVSGRELHMFLGIETPYTKWFERMLQFGFEEEKDFWTKKSESTGGRPSTDHIMKLDMAKELCMLARNEKGKQARQYFLEVEREWNTPEKVMARALKLADIKLKEITAFAAEQSRQLEEARPKVIFADAVSASKSSILIGEMAKLLRQNGINIGQKRLFEWMRDNGYLIKQKCADYNTPTQKSMEMGLFEIKKGTYVNGDGCVVTTRTVKVTGKGQQYLINKFLAPTKE